MFLRKMFIILLLSITAAVFSQENRNQLFLYIPFEEDMTDFLNMNAYLKAWDENQVTVNDEQLNALCVNYIGEDSLQSLQFETFLRFTKNKNIQNRILSYFDGNGINDTFAAALRKLYAAEKTIRTQDGRDVIQYNYRDSEFDENINLFSFKEVSAFGTELGLLLHDNDWSMLSITPEAAGEKEESFFLIYGGGTNSMTIQFKKYYETKEEEINSRINENFYREKYKENWVMTDIPLAGILERSGAEKIIIGHGLGPDIIETIETGTFNVYLYDRETEILYEVSYFMNFSPKNIHFAGRDRIFNYLFFQLLFVFINT
ncbi:hypothetical protein [Breznakiella homolactica]|uniref:Uncharacterized protein n=1 Tax=Breznakiella homolactica TaxID=2798577 RepID=A0A7T7XPF2_9SPIR|nr:hypothetical protein [Breznakiella homolactica]QQO09967.1 hypothetical protein JFL75_03370 [Breznakiella homolactica]